MEEAVEQIAEIERTPVVKDIVKYRFDTQAMQVIPYTVRQMEYQSAPTGRTITQLKPDVRFDENTGKFYRRSAGEVMPSAADQLSDIEVEVESSKYVFNHQQ